jgi:hypothetical protein
MDQLSEAFMCKKEFSVYFIYTLSLQFSPFLSYDTLRICFLTHLVRVYCILYAYSHRKGGELTREKVRGATVHKAGSKIPT